MAEKIKGITIQIDGETKGLQSALKEVNSKTKSLQTELKGVESLLKMDPGNVTLIAQKQELLGNIVAETKKKLDGLKNAQDDVNAAFKKGDVGEEQYRSFQREIIATEQKLKGLEAQQKQVNTAVDKMDMKSIGKGVATGVAAIGAAGLAAGAGLGVLIAQTEAVGSRVNDLSQKLGISAEGFQEWEYVMGQSGIDMENLKGGMKTLTKAMTDADSTGGEALRNLIGSVEGLSQEEVFNKSITAFQGMADGAEKNALALQIFGKSGQELLPVLNDSAAGTEALKKKAEELGLVMSDKAVRAADDFGDSLDTLTGAATGLRNNMVGELLPGITPVIDELTGFIGSMSTNIAEAGGDWGKVATIMGEGLANMLLSLIDKLPMIMDFGMKLLMALVQGILDNLPMIMDAAIQCIIAVTLGLAQAMPVLIPAIIDAVLLMVDVLLDNLPLLVNAAGQLMIGITLGLIKAIPKLLSAVPKIITSLVSALSGVGQQMLDVGADLVKGIWNGISNTTKWIWDKIKGFAGGIVDKVKGFFGIHSPSRLFRDDIGLQLGAGMALGIEDSIGKVKSAMSKLSATASPNVMLNSSAMIGGAPDSGILSTLKNIAANSGQQIILDTGVLVGQTAPKMNTALGILARR